MPRGIQLPTESLSRAILFGGFCSGDSAPAEILWQKIRALDFMSYTHGVGFEIICKRYSHSSPAITMRYLGIEDKEVHGVLMNEVG